MQALFLQAGGSFGEYTVYLYFAAIIGVFYFFFIRPQSKKAKDQKNFLETLQQGDAVVTSGGMHGKVAKIAEQTILLEIDQNVRIKVEKSSINLEFTKALNEKKDGKN